MNISLEENEYEESESEEDYEHSNNGMLFDTGISSSSEDEEKYEEEEFEEYVSEESEYFISEQSSFETTSTTTSTTTTNSTTTTTTSTTTTLSTEFPENESEEVSDEEFMQMDAITEEMEFPEPSEATFFEGPEEPAEIEEENSDEFSVRSASNVIENESEEEVEVEYDESEINEEPLILNDFIITPESEEEEEEILEFIEAKENVDSQRLTMGLVPRNLASFGVTNGYFLCLLI